VIGMHFMNPVPVMKLVEVISGLQTSQQTLTTTLQLAEAMGKVSSTRTHNTNDRAELHIASLPLPLLLHACRSLT